MNIKFSFNIVCFVALLQYACVWCNTRPRDLRSNRVRRSGSSRAYDFDSDPFFSNAFKSNNGRLRTIQNRCVNDICEECINGECKPTANVNMNDLVSNGGTSVWSQQSASRNFDSQRRTQSTSTSMSYSRRCQNDWCEECTNDVCVQCARSECKGSAEFDAFYENRRTNERPTIVPVVTTKSTTTTSTTTTTIPPTTTKASTTTTKAPTTTDFPPWFWFTTVASDSGDRDMFSSIITPSSIDLGSKKIDYKNI